MALVSDIIAQAFLDLGVIQPGETVSSDMQANAFVVLNQMISNWSVDQALAYLNVHQAFTLTAGTATYTVGTAGTLSTSARPLRVVSWKSQSGNFANGGPCLSFDEFRAKQQNLTAKRSVLAEMVAADASYPSINIEVFPVPDTSPGTLTLEFWTPVVAFASVGTTVTLPDGWEAAIHFNLAVQLAPQYARQTGITQELAANAQNTLNALKAKNAAILGIGAKEAA